MSSPYQPAPDQHDTAAFARPVPPPQAEQPGGPGWYVPGESVGRSNPEADYWAGKYRRQRRWTRALAAGATGTVLVAVGLGFVAWQSGSSDDLATAGQTQTDGTTPEATPDGATPEGTTPDGTVPDSTSPNGTAPDDTAPDAQAPDSSSVPLDSLPLPDSLRSLASTLGITDLSQLVQMGVSMGMISEEDAADLLAAVQGGAALGDLFGGGSGQDDSGSGTGAPPQGAPNQGSAPSA